MTEVSRESEYHLIGRHLNYILDRGLMISLAISTDGQLVSGVTLNPKTVTYIRQTGNSVIEVLGNMAELASEEIQDNE